MYEGKIIHAYADLGAEKIAPRPSVSFPASILRCLLLSSNAAPLYEVERLFYGPRQAHNLEPCLYQYLSDLQRHNRLILYRKGACV